MAETAADTSGAAPSRAVRGEQPVRFQLVRNFTISSLVLFVAVAVALSYSWEKLSLTMLHEEYERDNVNYARMFSNALWADYIAPLFPASNGQAAASLNTASEIRELHEKVLALARGTRIFKVKLYDVNGKTVYSTELGQIGEDKHNNIGVINALLGEVKSELVYRGSFSALEREVQNRHLVQSYIPHYGAAGNIIVGAFEVYSDATRYVAEIRNKRRQMNGIAAALLGALYAILIGIVKSSQTSITRQYRARQESEKALRDSEGRFRSLIEQSLTGVYVIQDGKFAYVNPRFADILGHTPQELIGTDPEHHILADDQPVRRAHLSRLLDGRQSSVGYAVRVRHKSGLTIMLGVQGTLAVYEGRPAVIGMAQDITERKRAQDQIAAQLQQIQRSMLQTVRSVSQVIELRDPYTAGHERRVGALARAIGLELGLTEERSRGLEIIGLLHDIGKVVVPSEILAKPGTLLPVEFALIKAHCQAGYEILKDVDFPWPVAEAILQHHERLDGSGYPRGLRGEDILLEARILAVADVVEAITSPRPYRAGHGVDAAMDEIVSHSGKIYDPQAAAACLRLFREKGYAIAS